MSKKCSNTRSHEVKSATPPAEPIHFIVAILLQEAFGPATFYVTETRLGGATDMTNGTVPTMGGGLLVRGNLRTSATEAFEFADAAITRMFGEHQSGTLCCRAL